MPASPSVTTSALVARDVTRTYAGRQVLGGLDVVASPGQVLALIGENGAGKSTLLRVLAGLEEPDGGTVVRPGDLGYLPQEPAFPFDATVGSALAEALAPLHAAVQRLEVLAADLAAPGAAEEYADLLEWAVEHDAWDASRRAEEAAARLGLGAMDPEREVARLSGGQRSRLALAALVARHPGCLLLDEPTNHLDAAAVDWLEDVLRAHPGVVVVASHDRVFLDRVADRLLDLDPLHGGSDGHGGRVYGRRGGSGAYEEVLRERTAARRRWEQAYLDHQEQVDAARHAAKVTARQVAPHNRQPRDNDRFIYAFKGAKVQRAVSRRVRDAERRLESLEQARVPRPPRPLSFEAPPGPATVQASVRVRDLHVPGRLRLERLDVGSGERLLVTGANGCGKSTLLAVLAGQRPAGTLGDVQVRGRRLGYLPQDVRFRDPSLTPLQVYAASGATVPIRDLGLISGREASRPVGALSLGQQRRLALAVLVGNTPDLILLDEPTNHLSLALADELQEALESSPATVIIASHDRWLRSRWTGEHQLHLSG